MITYPRSVADLDAAWASALLGVDVTALEQLEVVRGTGTKVKLRLDYARPTDLPETMWAKSGLESVNAGMAGLCGTEAAFFADFAPLLPIDCPKAIATQRDPASADGIVLLEDLALRPVTFADADDDLDDATIRAILAELAGLHAALWRDARLDASDWLLRGGEIRRQGVIDHYAMLWDASLALPRGRFIPEELRDRARITAALHANENADVREACCLVHGDPHTGNLYFNADGRPGYVDWQTVMHGHWAHDVAYLITTVQPVAARRKNERAQLAWYLDRLAAASGDTIAFEDGWQAYRRHAIYPFNFSLCPTSQQPEYRCEINAERACAAIVDLGSVEALLG